MTLQMPRRPKATRSGKRATWPWFSGTVMGLFALCGAFGSLLAPHDPTQNDLGNALQPPFFNGGTTEYLLGTDQLGRDILSRLLAGAQVSFLVALGAVAIAGALGSAAGRSSDAVIGRRECGRRALVPPQRLSRCA